jgi:hypothetical protein
MSGEIIAGIDNPSLILLGFIFGIEIYGFIIGDDVLLAIGLGATLLLYLVRIRNRHVNRQESLAPTL